MNDHFLTLDEFHDAMREIEPVFDVKQRLPEQVFKRSYRFHLFCEFDPAMQDLPKALQTTQSPSANETALFCVLDSDPITFFYKKFQKVYGFYFRANISPADYYGMGRIEPNSVDDPTPFHTELEVYLSKSASRAMWGERTRETAVIGLDDAALAAYLVNETGNWMDAETALNRFARFPFANRKVPEEFRRTLIANYGCRAVLEKKLGQKVEYSWEHDEAPPRA